MTVTVADEVKLEFACDIADMLTVIGNVPVVGAMYSPLESIVPPPCVFTAQFTPVLPEVPVTDAVNCQFAPAPI